VAFQALYRRYRPQRFGEVKGQEHVVTALRNAVRDEAVAHAYLFSGPRGTGKTSTARILAKALNCEAVDQGEPCGVCEPCRSVEEGTSLAVTELDAASNNGVEAVRDLIQRAALGTTGRTKVYIVDEVHMLSNAASNALLKTLEEPPGHVVFVLATTDPHKVLPTIRSRTQHYDFRLLGASLLGEHLRQVVADAGLDVADAAIDRAVRKGDGSARDALSALDQIVAAGGEGDDDASVDEVVEGLCERDTARALGGVAMACATGADPRSVAAAVSAHLRDALLALMAPDLVSLPDAARERVADQARRLGAPALVRALEAVGDAVLALPNAPDPRVTLEVALVKVTRPDADTSPGAILERLERLERTAREATTAVIEATSPLSDEVATTTRGGPPPWSAPSPRSAISTPVAPAQAEGPKVPPAPRGVAARQPSASSHTVGPADAPPGTPVPPAPEGAVHQPSAPGGAAHQPTASSGTAGPAGAPAGTRVPPGREGAVPTAPVAADTAGPADAAPGGKVPPAPEGTAHRPSANPAESAAHGVGAPAGGSAAGAREVLAAVQGRHVEAGDPPVAAAHKPALGSLARSTPKRPSARPGPAAGHPPGAGDAAPLAAAPEAADPAPLPALPQLVRAWDEQVLARLSSVSKGRFSTGRFVDVSDGAAVLALPNPIMRDKCEEKRPELERVLAEHFGQRVPVRLVVDPAVSAAPGGAPAARREVEHEDDVDLDDLVDAPGDARTGIDRLTEAFPGAEVLGDG